VHYKGALASNLMQFDEGDLEFRLGRGRVIKGWDMGVRGMTVGEIRRLFVPAKLAYSYVGTPGGPIPPNADLIYEIELLGIKDNEV
ncbi:hypothetical protein GUITHDRAFT_79453, partial [Guillardia theta CCMP2712]